MFSRRLLQILVILVLLLVVIVAGGWFYARTSLPQTTGSVKLSGLQGPVEIVRDGAGVPHIFASDDGDALFALGYLHAQDRMWQLEVSRRIGAGRLSEVLGEAALPSDKYLRTLGTYRAAAAEWSSLEPRTQQMLQAYVAGINAWIAEGHTLPPEFLILGFKPEPWTTTDSMVWAKMMSWDMGGDHELEALRARLVLAIGAERTAQLMPPYPADGITILDSSALTAPLTSTVPSSLDTSLTVPLNTPLASSPASSLSADGLDALLALESQVKQNLALGEFGIGSNNWVVSGKMTDSGMPLLADDPHLGARIPSTWYLAEIQGKELHVTGSTLPGLPFAVIGHNERIAWGITNVNPDVQDLYIEHINPANPNQVEVDGQWVDMQISEEVIYVKGEAEPIQWAARSTRHGPLVSDASESPMPVALRWTSLDDDDTTLDAYADINYAANWDEFRQALQRYVAPSQNFVFADVDNNIGYFVPGRIPIRPQGDGMLPVPGWTSEDEWTGWIPFDELPQSYNPPAGYIVTANNRVEADGYPYLISNDYHPPYRAQRIVDLIQAGTANGATIGVDEMRMIQGDQVSLQAQELLPLLLAVAPADERQRQALEYLHNWDGNTSKESIASAIYHVWYLHLTDAIVEDDLPPDLFKTVSERSYPLFIHAALSDPQRYAGWCDNVLSAPLETCADSARLALTEALDDLSERLGNDMGKWQWGAVHKTIFPHTPFSEVSLLRPLFERQIENGGDSYTVNVGTIDLKNLYNQRLVPSYRHIVDMSNLGQSLFMHPTGQSGNVLSRHYDDLIERHQAVQYLPMSFGREGVSGDVLTLQPK